MFSYYDREPPLILTLDHLPMTKHDRIVGLTTIILIVAGLFFVTDKMTQVNTTSAFRGIETEGQTQVLPSGNLDTEINPSMTSIPLLNVPAIVAESGRRLSPPVSER